MKLLMGLERIEIFKSDLQACNEVQEDVKGSKTADFFGHFSSSFLIDQ